MLLTETLFGKTMAYLMNAPKMKTGNFCWRNGDSSSNVSCIHIIFLLNFLETCPIVVWLVATLENRQKEHSNPSNFQRTLSKEGYGLMQLRGEGSISFWKMKQLSARDILLLMIFCLCLTVEKGKDLCRNGRSNQNYNETILGGLSFNFVRCQGLC